MMALHSILREGAQRGLLFLCLILLKQHAGAAPPGAIVLWPGAPPGGAAPGPQRDSAKGAITQVGQPYLIVHRPAQPNGMAILLASGGGYARVEAGKESGPAAAWLQTQGITAFELVYRLPQEGGGVAAPFQDGQRAMRVIRARAAEWRIDPARIGMLGFSAGAHLAGMTAVQPDAALYAPVDALDAVSARPDFAVLLYPVLTMQPPFDTTQAKRQLLGRHPAQAARDALSVERQADARAPPMFIAQALDDGISPPGNSVLMAAALRRAGVPVELHQFRHGGHGWGLGQPGSEPAAWPRLLLAWLRTRGWLAD
ncbi:alpha/beta hydrolase [Janthinobacterium sp. BJB303]|uniref:alpha/beta hydrolase n=2 Tax=Janthinobacterium sp. GW458P TaxID=1981504 RepID=UPI000C112AFA|nr:alpha/beta hydrolase [Janthinobacterium sp. GW458P]MBE3025527.1 alpha/beta hydrolase [Janthinobacterium sp. GW458P]PHV14405.1 alpha/beta hydrolase [Janthinobacterium sp. BJB303]